MSGNNTGSNIKGISRSDAEFLEALVNSVPAGTGGGGRKMNPDNVEDLMNDIDNFAMSMDIDFRRKPVSAASVVEKFISESCPYFTLEDDPGARFYVIHNVTIGRLPHNDIQVKDAGVSRLHCRVFTNGGQYYCVDMTPGDSQNKKAVLDGRPVDNGHPKNTEELFMHVLKNGSRLTVGSTTLVFHINTQTGRQYSEDMQDCSSSVTV